MSDDLEPVEVSLDGVVVSIGAGEATAGSKLGISRAARSDDERFPGSVVNIELAGELTGDQ